jgi:hypothetical protein
MSNLNREHEMDIQALEARYQTLTHQLQTGHINQATFETALDQLKFYDAAGRCWMIGAQTGDWYVYDGHSWQQGDPRTAELPARRILPAINKLKLPQVAAVVLMMAGILLLSLLILPVSQASPGELPLLAPSPRPPLPEDGGDKDRGSERSAIYGTITDLSRRLPAAGVEVLVNGAVVRTDTDGSYSITGLNAGAYVVSVELHGQGEPVQGPVHVVLDGNHHATVDLDFYSQPAPTDTPQPTLPAPTVSPAATPADLPDSGAPIGFHPPTIFGLGLLFVITGVILYNKTRPNLHYNNASNQANDSSR